MLANREATIIKKYGSLENFYKYKGNKNKETWDKKHDYILAKINKKKKLNNTFQVSNMEKDFYNILVNKYGKEDVVKQYKDENRYPFNCDFYIKSKDLFIELNLHWSHGGHLFNPNNPEDLNLLKHWEEKSSNSLYFKNAINTWTKRDVEKFKIAKENNLNYEVIYNKKELYEKYL